MIVLCAAAVSSLRADMLGDARKDIDTRIDIQYTTMQLEQMNRRVNALILESEETAVQSAKESLTRATSTLLETEIEKRNDEITGLEHVLKSYPTSPLIPEVMLRLAELYYEQTNQAFMQGMKEYEHELDMGRNPGPPPRISYKKSIDMYTWFIERYPDNKYADLAYYLRGYCYGEQGDEKQAADNYIDITKKFPASQFIPEVWFRLGEYYFNNNWLSYAEDAYAKVLQYKDSMFYDMALYKEAWTFFREDKYDQSLADFVDVVDRSDRAGSTQKRESMRAEALEYISLILGENRTPSDTDAFLNRVKWGRYYAFITQKVGGVYEKLNLYNFAIQAYNNIIQKLPGTVDAIEALYNEMVLYERIGKFGNANDVRLIITKDYGIDSPFMGSIKDPEAKGHAVDILKKATLSLVTDLIGISRQKGRPPSPEQYREAQKVLLRYMKDFPDDKEIPLVHFFYALMAYKLNEFRAAGEFYKKVALTSMYVDKKYRNDAAFNMVKSYEEALKETADTTPYDEKLKEFVEACDVYASLYPEAGDAPKVLYKAGETLYKAKHYADAIKTFQKLLLTYRSSDLTQDVLRYIVTAYGERKDQSGLERWGVQILKYNVLSDNPGAMAYIKDVLGKLWFIKAKAAFDKGDWEQSYTYYNKAIASISPEQTDTSITRDKAIYNMGVVLNKMGSVKQARGAFEDLIKNYPSSGLIPSAILELGLSYEKDLRFDRAMDMYTSIVDRYSSSPQAKDATYNLAVLKEKIGDYGSAARYYEDYEGQYASEKERPQFSMYTAEDYFKAGETDKALKLYQKLCDKPQDAGLSVQACFKAAKLWEDSSLKKSGKLYGRVITLFSQMNKSESQPYVYYYAGAQFFFAEQYFKLYSDIKFKSTATLQKVFNEKTSMLAKLNGKLTDIVGLGAPEYAISSLYLDANAYEQFYTDVINSPVPRGLSDEEESLYESMLAEKVGTVKDNAISIYKKTLDKAYQLGIESKYVEMAKDGLERLDPVESLSYPPREKNVLRIPLLPASTEKLSLTGKGYSALTKSYRGPFLLFFETEDGYDVKTFSAGTD